MVAHRDRLDYSILSDAYHADPDAPCVFVYLALIFYNAVIPDTGVLVPPRPGRL